MPSPSRLPPPRVTITDYQAKGMGIYRVFWPGGFADLELFWADGSREWCADIRLTNRPDVPEYIIADAAVAAITGGMNAAVR